MTVTSYIEDDNYVVSVPKDFTGTVADLCQLLVADPKTAEK